MRMSPRIGGDFGRQEGVVEHRGIRGRRKRSNGCDGSIEEIKHMMKVLTLVRMYNPDTSECNIATSMPRIRHIDERECI
jgi:hypothetical protein